MELVDGGEEHLLRVLVGDVADHERRPLVLRDGARCIIIIIIIIML